MAFHATKGMALRSTSTPWPTTTGMFVNDLYLPAGERCMAEMFRGAGYATAYIGKWHLDGHGRETYIPPERRHGWDYWKAAECDHDYNHSHYYKGSSPEKRFWPGYDAFAQTEDAIAYLRRQAKARGWRRRTSAAKRSILSRRWR